MHKILAIIISFLVVWFSPLILVDDIDPAFISNTYYDAVIWWILPIISLGLWFLFVVQSHKQAKIDPSFESLRRSQMSTDNKWIKLFKLNKAFYWVGPLILIYVIFWAFISPVMELSNYYLPTKEWSKEYNLINTSNCGIDYSSKCIKLEVKDISSNKIYTFRWYEARGYLHSIKGSKLYLTGDQTLFGSFVATINC